MLTFGLLIGFFLSAPEANDSEYLENDLDAEIVESTKNKDFQQGLDKVQRSEKLTERKKYSTVSTVNNNERKSDKIDNTRSFERQIREEDLVNGTLSINIDELEYSDTFQELDDEVKSDIYTIVDLSHSGDENSLREHIKMMEFEKGADYTQYMASLINTNFD